MNATPTMRANARPTFLIRYPVQRPIDVPKASSKGRTMDRFVRGGVMMSGSKATEGEPVSGD